MQVETSFFGKPPISLFPPEKCIRLLPEVIMENGDLIVLTKTGEVLLLRSEVRIGMKVMDFTRLDELIERPENPVSICQIGHHKETSEGCFEDFYVIARSNPSSTNQEEFLTLLEHELLNMSFLILKYKGSCREDWAFACRITHLPEATGQNPQA